MLIYLIFGRRVLAEIRVPFFCKDVLPSPSEATKSNDSNCSLGVYPESQPQ